MRRRMSPRVVLAALALAACSSSSSDNGSRAFEDVELNVHVAASMTQVFTELGEKFRETFPGVTVKFNFAGSSTLATQIQQGAPADVVVLADSTSIEKLVASGDVERADIMDLARNKLAILVAPGNPSRIASLSDLTRQGLKVVLCDASQPCGRYTERMLSGAGVSIMPASREASATAVVSRIASGEADAGIAYLTDGLVSGHKVDAVAIPDSLNVFANYPIAPVANPASRDAAAVAAFIAMARGPIGDALLVDAGFLLP